METSSIACRLKRIALAGAALLLSIGPAAAQTERELGAAGVCGRCHVPEVIVWGVSAHFRAGAGCTACHGASNGHVLDERNNVTPDRVTHGRDIAGLCQSCHARGCTRTASREGCETCHQVHGLFDPRKKTETGGAPRRDEEALKDRQYRDVMAAGEALARQGRWKEALDQFENARRLRPTDAQASRRAAFCLRRFNPGMKGFRLLAEDFDPATGLPVRVEAPELGLKMVLVPGGDVEIGDPAFADSRLVHTVHVEPFYLGQYEVTQEQWLRLMASNPSFHQSGFPDHSELPVENVSWLDCQEFLARLNRQVPGAGFRLPTEAEWEYAARRGGTTIPLEEVARYRDNSRIKAGGKGDPSEFALARVGSKRASNLGLCDMQGNVWEWCSSLFWPYPYDRADGREDPHRDGLRVLRGGAYLDGAELLAVGLRHADRPQQRFRWNGLRLARTVPGN